MMSKMDEVGVTWESLKVDGVKYREIIMLLMSGFTATARSCMGSELPPSEASSRGGERKHRTEICSPFRREEPFLSWPGLKRSKERLVMAVTGGCWRLDGWEDREP